MVDYWVKKSYLYSEFKESGNILFTKFKTISVLWYVSVLLNFHDINPPPSSLFHRFWQTEEV